MNPETRLEQQVTPPSGAACALRRTAGPVLALGACAAVACYLVLGDEIRTMASLGVAAGTVCCLLALAIEAKALAVPADAKGGAARFQIALAAGFAVLFFGVAGSMLALIGLGMKFSQWSAFGLAFAGAALVLHVAGVFVLGRARPASSSSTCRVA